MKDMIVSSIIITSIIFPGINPLPCLCFVRSICNVNLDHDFARRYRYHSRHTLIILRDIIGRVLSSYRFQLWSDAMVSVAEYGKLFLGPKETLITVELDLRYFFHQNILVKRKHILKDNCIQLKLLDCG